MHVINHLFVSKWLHVKEEEAFQCIGAVIVVWKKARSTINESLEMHNVLYYHNYFDLASSNSSD